MTGIFPETFKGKKNKIKILILGPYRPSNAEKRLIEFRKSLHLKDYLNAKLVADFPDIPRYHDDWDIHCTLKSQFHIKHWADALIFVFLKDADNQGVANELTFTCQKVLEKTHLSLVLIEQGVQLSSLTRGPIKIHKINADDFENDTELCHKAIGYCTNFVFQLFWVL